MKRRCSSAGPRRLYGYGSSDLADSYQLPLLDWASIENNLGADLTQAPDTGGPNRHSHWLVTINADGSPHVTGVGAL